MKPYKAPAQFAGHIPGDCIAARMRALRGTRGMTVKQFAEFTGLKEDQITGFESDRQFSTKDRPRLDDLARKCGVQPAWLYAGSEVPKRMWPDWWNPEVKSGNDEKRNPDPVPAVVEAPAKVEAPVLEEGAQGGRSVCTKLHPFVKGAGGFWSHPDAKMVEEEYGGLAGGGDYERYECPNCGEGFWVELPD